MCSLFVISCILFSCHEEKINRIPLKIIFAKLPKNFTTEDNMLSTEATNLLEGIITDTKRCQDTIILDPIFVRADIVNSDTSMAYPSKKSSLARTSVKREFKLLDEYLRSISIPTVLTERVSTKSDSLYEAYILSNSDLRSDSLLVYSSIRKVDSLDINNRKYKAFSDVESVRGQIQSILCSNPKATIALLIDPPSTAISSQLTISDIRQDCNIGTLTVQASGGDGSPVMYSVAGLSGGQPGNKLVLPETMRSGKLITVVATQNGQRFSKQFTTNCTPIPPQVTVERISTISRRTVVSRTWTRVAGSNFCVGSCVLAYTERDNLGHTRERRINNYAGCCPANN
jgi:hypothetical protein